jgi:CrcB protein
MNYLLMMIGGAVGALCRYHLSSLVQTHMRGNYPLGTFLINVTGSFGLGALVGLLANHPTWPAEQLTLLFGVGFFAAYTTFSSFAFETLQLWRVGQRRNAIVNLLGQPLLGCLAAWIGIALVWRLV